MRNLVHSAIVKSIFWGAIPIGILITVAFYIRIYRELSKMVKFKDGNGSVLRALVLIMKTKQNSDAIGQAYKLQMKEIKTTILMFITVFFFVLCWLPGALAFLLLVIAPKSIDAYHRDIALILYSVNSILNPFFYAFHISRLRKKLKQILSWFCCKSTIKEIKTISSAVSVRANQRNAKPRVSFEEFELYF